MKTNIKALNSLFKELYPNGINDEEIKKREYRSTEDSWYDKKLKISNSLPVLVNGKYKVKFLRDIVGMYDRVIGKAGEEKIVTNQFNNMSDRSMGGPFFSGFINIDNGMSPAEYLIPEQDVEILEFIGK